MRDGAATRDRIDRTALGLFVTKGVTETTIRDIAQGAGIAEGALYRHYRGKDELIWELFARHYGELARTLEALQTEQKSVDDKLAAMIGECCRLFDTEPILFRFLLLVQHHSLHRLDADIKTPVAVLHRVIAAGIASGEIGAKDPDLGTALVLGILLQPATFKVYGRITQSMTSLAPSLVAACRRVLQA